MRVHMPRFRCSAHLNKEKKENKRVKVRERERERERENVSNWIYMRNTCLDFDVLRI